MRCPSELRNTEPVRCVSLQAFLDVSELKTYVVKGVVLGAEDGVVGKQNRREEIELRRGKPSQTEFQGAGLERLR